MVQRAMELQERLLALTAELKKALLHQLFTAGLRGEPQKQTDLGPVPESWEVVALEDICTFLSGGTPSKQKPEFWKGLIPWVSPKDMKKAILTDVVDHISDAALEEGSSLAPAGSVFCRYPWHDLIEGCACCLGRSANGVQSRHEGDHPGTKNYSEFPLVRAGCIQR